jgi:GNAT superfamily N-acetyltransferase
MIFTFTNNQSKITGSDYPMTQTEASVLLKFLEVNQDTWADMERLFEGRGGPKTCWCMVWRAIPAEAKDTSREARKAALKLRVDNQTPIGILGYQDQEPVAWCSIAPRPTYRRLGGNEDDPQENVWALVCFYVVRRLRGLGITQQLIEAAVAQAKRKGATIVEAYPVEPDSPSYRFMGFIESFKAAGFEEVGRVGVRRHIFRRRVG